jgi:hypothetical protein
MHNPLNGLNTIAVLNRNVSVTSYTRRRHFDVTPRQQLIVNASYDANTMGKVETAMVCVLLP